MTNLRPARPGFGRPTWRLAWLIPGGIALLAGLDAALLLLGLPAPITTDRLPDVHGVLLALGFVATLVSLERATALGRWFGYLAPALLGLGGLLTIATPVPLVVGKYVLLAGTVAFTLMYIPLWRRNYDPTLFTQLLGAALAIVGANLWLGIPSDAPFWPVAPWLIGFLVLTIAAERVELARVTMPAGAGRRLLVFACALIAALAVGWVAPNTAAIALGATILALMMWLLVHDVARRTIRSTGVTRYMAACILAGYLWLAVAGVTLLFGAPAGPDAYDAILHAVFLGYTFSMIMAHATTILPAVLRIQLPWRPAFWVPISLLQVSLIVRIGIGDGLGLTAAWRWGSVLAVAALLVFALTAVVTAAAAARSTRTMSPRRTAAP